MSHAPLPPRDQPGATPTRNPPGATPPRNRPGATPTLALERAGLAAEAWAPTAARILLGLVLLWFGYHELIDPGVWTGYVPVISTTSHAAEVLVLAHGWLLLVLAVALIAGIAPRIAASLAAMMLLEIIISLGVHGLSDLVLRDVGVFGLAVAVAGTARQRLMLR